MKPPVNAIWDRKSFLEARAKQTAVAKEAVVIRGWEHIVIDAGDEIVCDDCNALIEGADVLVVRSGRRAVCRPCFDLSHAAAGTLEDWRNRGAL